MNGLVPLSKFSKLGGKYSFLSNSSVVVDKKGIPLGFVFGRDSFISLLEKIDSEFEKNVSDSKLAYDNPAGGLIDLIEAKLPLNPSFIADLKKSIDSAKKEGWIPFKEVIKTLKN